MRRRVLAESRRGRRTWRCAAACQPDGNGLSRQAAVLFLVPGNPVSCLCAYDLFVGRAVRRLGGRGPVMPYPTRALPLARKIASMVGRENRLCSRADCRWQGGAVGDQRRSILSSTTRADGFVIVPGDLEGHAEGEVVLVHLYGFSSRVHKSADAGGETCVKQGTVSQRAGS